MKNYVEENIILSSRIALFANLSKSEILRKTKLPRDIKAKTSI